MSRLPPGREIEERGQKQRNASKDGGKKNWEISQKLNDTWTKRGTSGKMIVISLLGKGAGRIKEVRESV